MIRFVGSIKAFCGCKAKSSLHLCSEYETLILLLFSNLFLGVIFGIVSDMSGDGWVNCVFYVFSGCVVLFW